jgi:hypothetical protein
LFSGISWSAQSITHFESFMSTTLLSVTISAGRYCLISINLKVITLHYNKYNACANVAQCIYLYLLCIVHPYTFYLVRNYCV